MTLSNRWLPVLCVLLVILLSCQSAEENENPGPMVDIPGGTFWYGTQVMIGDKLIPNQAIDGAAPRVKKTVKPFRLEKYTVTNEKFAAFVKEMGYVTEAETFGWSFVLEQLASKKVIKQVDGKKGYGRVKDSSHWMAVPEASWAKPYGKDSPDMLSADNKDLPVVQVSYRDAEQYCAWAGRRLPTEEEWEYAARGGRSKQNYPWGDELLPGRMNVWEGAFPGGNTLQDGYLGPALVHAYAPNAYGLHNMVGNVWEWVAGGTPEKRVLRGGSFIDSVDGKFNHVVRVSTRQENSGDSAASNTGFRCAADADKGGTTVRATAAARVRDGGGDL